jgi:HEAT repeat protein
MVVTIEQILFILNSTEPNYEEGAKLGAEALPHLEKLINTADSVVASKAAYFASFIDDEKSVDVLILAARSGELKVREAAVVGSNNLKNTEQRKIVLAELKNDQDANNQS